MMDLRLDGTADLEHRAYFLRAGQPRCVVAAAREGGQLSVVTLGSAVQRLPGLPERIRAVTPHPSDERLALVDGSTGSLLVLDPAGYRFFEAPPPQPHGDAPNWVKPGFDDCFFDESGEYLWLVSPRSGGFFEIELLETRNWSLAATATAEDPFGGGDCSFHGTGRPGLVSLWLAAGPEGQQVFWLSRDGSEFTCTPERRLTNTIPPVFSPGGGRCLVIDDDYAIRQFEFPGMRPIGSPLASGDEDDPFGTSLAFLNERRALAGTGEGRMFAVDTLGMTIDDEVALDGHDPRPIGEYYPRLAHESGLGTDISYFERLGDVIVFVCRRGLQTGSKEWKDTLLWVAVE